MEALREQLLNELRQQNVNPAFQDYRMRQLQALENSQLPTVRDEEWRYTSLKNLAGDAKVEIQRDITTDLKRALDSIGSEPLVVFKDGVMERSSGIEDLNATLLPLADVQGKDTARMLDLLQAAKFNDKNFISSLNLAGLQAGLFIQLDRNRVETTPLHIVYYGSESEKWHMPQLLIQQDANSELEIIEYYLGSANSAVTNTLASIDLAEGAGLTRKLVQYASTGDYHFSNTSVRQARSSNYSNYYFGLGGQMARDNVEIIHRGEGCETDLQGLYLGEGNQHQDTRTYIDHALPHCNSNQHYRGVLSDTARGVFNGKVLVQQDAQKTNAEQLNKNLLLSTEARVDAKPQLEIFADDVKCSHGSTAGQLDSTAIFYLRSRGIGEAEARRLLTEGFAREISEVLPEGSFRSYIDSLIEDKLSRLTDGNN